MAEPKKTTKTPIKRAANTKTAKVSPIEPISQPGQTSQAVALIPRAMTAQTAQRLASGKQLGGRPTKYREEYCRLILEYFRVPETKTLKKTYTTKAGTVIEEEIEVANDLVTLEKFADSIGVNGDTLVEWASQYDEFSAAYTRAKDLQRSMIIINGTQGRYQPQFTIFAAKNIAGMTDRVELDAMIGTYNALPVEAHEVASEIIKRMFGG